MRWLSLEILHESQPIHNSVWKKEDVLLFHHIMAKLFALLVLACLVVLVNSAAILEPSVDLGYAFYKPSVVKVTRQSRAEISPRVGSTDSMLTGSSFRECVLQFHKHTLCCSAT